MATPRLGLVVEDKPTELSCTLYTVCLHNDDIIILNVFDWLTVTGEHCLELSIVRFKHTQLQVQSTHE